MKEKATILAMVLMAMVMVSNAHGEIIFVDADANGANDGSSWADAYKYLQDALADALSSVKPVEILVAEGIYQSDRSTADPNGSGDRTATFQLINGITVKGGFAGFGELNPDERDIALYETILSGDLADNDIDVNDPRYLLSHPSRAENSLHVVTGSETDETAVLDGFTITAGNATGPHLDYEGGGMFNYRGSPTINNCTFSSHSALWGGGMDNYRGSPKLTDCTFDENWAGGGGGIYNSGGSPILNNCAFIKNWASEGGGMHNRDESSPTITNCTFSGNSADDYGGGMYNDNSSPILLECTFNGNLAYRGGGMYNYRSNPTVTNCVFSGNSTRNGGGGIYNGYNSNPTLTNCSLTGNYTNNSGGGIACFNYCNPKINNCNITANIAGETGGGIVCFFSNPTITSCTISGNTALVSGGGISCYPGPPPPPTTTFRSRSNRRQHRSKPVVRYILL